MSGRSELSKIKREVKILSSFIQNEKEELRFERPVQFKPNKYIIKN